MTQSVERPRTGLKPAMVSAAGPEWAGAQWVGMLDEESPLLAGSSAIALLAAEGYTRARLLVRSNGRVRGLLDIAIHGGCLEVAAIRAAALQLPAPDEAPAIDGRPSVTVLICTRDRADQLAVALESVLAVDYADFDVIVVDNAPATDATERLVADMGDPRVRLVTEPRPGLSRARNRGLLHASGDIVAFTDDDVTVDPHWISRLVDGFGRDPQVVCVTGLVPSGELRTPTQTYFDLRVSWAKSCRGRVFSLTSPPPDVPMFPFQVGMYGTGANLALRRDAAFAMGGFDEALGAGSETCGGEDIDMFVRVLTAGHALAYEPSAIVWHRHRSDTAALQHQATGYGIGLGAWLTKVMFDRRLVTLALRRAVRAAAQLRSLGATVPSEDAVWVELEDVVSGIGRSEQRAVLRGPLRYLHERRSGAKSKPLLGLSPASQADRVLKK